MIKRIILLIAICALFICATGCRRAAELPPEAELGEPPMPESTLSIQTPEATARPAQYEGAFELPVQGATGYAAVSLNLRAGPGEEYDRIGTLAAGSGFQILGEEGDFWRVTDGQTTGYAAHRFCMINLPDIIPSIVYDNTNSYDSRIRSSGVELPGVSGRGLYENTAYNPRFGEDEFIMPVLYSMAPKIQAAQRSALADGNSLKIYEAYRPRQAQRQVVKALSRLSDENSAVRAGISTQPWKMSWFASQGISHHQRGCAIDVSLVKARDIQRRVCGPYAYDSVSDYEEYEMPTPIHELSIAAAAFSQPVSSSSPTAWRSARPAEGMNQAAQALQKYCADAGLTPLASEWWHFNDLETYERIKNDAGTGEFILTRVHSAAP